MSKHTQEPWFHHGPSGSQHSQGGYINASIDRSSPAICHVYGSGFTYDERNGNASRIVDCVNACAGMTDPAAEIAELKRQRDELMSALHDAATSLETIQMRSSVARTAIAKAKGGAA